MKSSSVAMALFVVARGLSQHQQVGAQEPARSKDERVQRTLPQTDSERMVERCIQVVRKELPLGRFDAYVKDKFVNMFGTAEARFKFEKCMAQRGYPLAD